MTEKKMKTTERIILMQKDAADTSRLTRLVLSKIIPSEHRWPRDMDDAVTWQAEDANLYGDIRRAMGIEP